MKILITGGAGFIGSNLVRALNTVDSEIEIVVLDDLSTGLASNLENRNCALIVGSILDFSLVRQLTEGVDAIVHLAAVGSVPKSIRLPRESHDANITGTLNVLESAREAKTPHVVVASSSAVYGSNPSLPKRETDWTRPISPYGVTKLATEGYAIAYANSYGMKILPLRFFNVYGPRQRPDHPYAAVIPRFLSAAITGRSVEIYGDGHQTRDFTFVEDVTNVIASSLLLRVGSLSPVNLAFGSPYSLLDALRMIEEELGTTLEIEFHASRPSDVRNSSADNSLLVKTFGPVEKTDLRIGLRKTIEWIEKALII